ncbi:MFS transporter [Bacillus sp. N3536]|nr:MFS transporter [Bacillus sp. N3536]
MKEKLWTKDFVSITLINFFLMLTFYLLMVTISVFAVNEFQSNASAAGFASSIFVIGALVGRLFGGRYIDKLGQKKLLLIGIGIMIMTAIVYFFVESYMMLSIIRVIHGIAFGIAGTATGTIVAQAVPTTRRGAGIGYFALSMTVATAIGPFIGMFILAHFAFNYIFIFCLVCVVISFLLSLMIKVKELPEEKHEEEPGRGIFKFIEKKAAPVSLVAAVTAFCYAGIISFLSFFASEHSLTEAASFFFVVYAVAVLVSRPFTGKLFDNKGPNSIMYPAIISFAIGMFMLSQANNAITLLIAGAFIGFGYGTYMSSSQAAAIKEVSAHRVGLATATFFILTDIGLGVGPFLQGYLVPSIGYNGLFLILGILLVLCLPLHYFLYGKHAKLS